MLRETKYAWVDPNGVLSRTGLEADVARFRGLGLIITPIDLSRAYADQYRQFAVRYLGEYRAPR